MCHFRVWNIALGSPSYWWTGGAGVVGAGTSRVKLLARRRPMLRFSEREPGRLEAVANFSTESCPARPDPRESDGAAASTVNPLTVADDKVWSRLTPAMSRCERCAVATRAQATCRAHSSRDWSSSVPAVAGREDVSREEEAGSSTGRPCSLGPGDTSIGVTSAEASPWAISMGSSAGWGQSTS